jgi:hypothetical protein
MAGLWIALTLAATHALCFAAGGWYLRYRALIHQMRAAQTAIHDRRHLADVLADYRQQLRRIVRLPHLHVRNAR